MNNLDELSYSIIGSCYEVYKDLGYGFLEKVYENALVYELKNKGFEVETQKDVKVTSVGTTVNMDLDSADTKIGNYINKPVTYWYEIELNPDTSPLTIIGYDNDGPKKFILYPEAGETT